MTFVLFVLPILLYSLRDNKSNYIYWLFSLFMFILLAFRNPNTEGNDTHNYLTWYLYGEAYLKENAEYGYMLLNLIAIKLGLGFQWVLILTSFISIGALSMAAIRSDKKPFHVLLFVFLLTYYFYNFNAMRQMTGVSILMLGYTYLIEGRWKVFVLVTFIASLFHTTSLIGLIALFFYFGNLKMSQTWINILMPLSFVLGGLNVTANLLGGLSNLLPRYIGDDIYAMGDGDSFSISRLMLTCFFMYMYPKFEHESLYTKLSLFGIILFNMMSFDMAAMRIAYAFTPVQAFLYSEQKKGTNKIDSFNRSIIYAYAMFVYYYMLSNNMSGMLDYHFCNTTYF